MYNNWYAQHQQHAGSTSQGAAAAPAWVSQAGFQTDRSGELFTKLDHQSCDTSECRIKNIS